MKEKALQTLMGAYQQSSDLDNMKGAALGLLQVSGNNLRVLAVLVRSDCSAADQNQNPEQNLAQAEELASRGLNLLKATPKPNSISDLDYEKLTSQVSVIFNRALGLTALRNNDYAAAQQHLRAPSKLIPTISTKFIRWHWHTLMRTLRIPPVANCSSLAA